MYLNGIWAIGPFKGSSSFWARIKLQVNMINIKECSTLNIQHDKNQNVLFA